VLFGQTFDVTTPGGGRAAGEIVSLGLDPSPRQLQLADSDGDRPSRGVLRYVDVDDTVQVFRRVRPLNSASASA
jgi:hypothetical protein